MDFDFGYGQSTTSNNASSDNGSTVTNLDNGKQDNSNNGEPVANLDDGDGSQGDDNHDKGGSDGDGQQEPPKTNTTDNNGEDLEPGTTIDVDGQTYSIDDKGNVIDANGNIFKEKSEVNDWIKSFDDVTDTTEGSFDIQSIQEAIGVEIVGDDDKPIQFENSPEGIKAYVNSVIETARDENYQTAINSLYERYPIVKDMLAYYIANGESMDGYGEIPDRSGITVDDSNEAQQEAIIRMAWDEQNRRGDVDSYIQYLKSSGTLLATAQEELQGLQEADANYRKQIEEEAEQAENERLQDIENYWNKVGETIASKKIAGYQIPDNIIINRNGKQIAVTPNDFYNYLYMVDENGQSAYARDLAQETPEAQMEDQLLRAYLKFTGGSYSNLVDMAINDEKVKNLKLRAKGTAANSIRINRPKVNTPQGVNVDLGYN